MELVYLWVEEYKNIRNQGFNFSPRFECEYRDGNLTICDKKKKECKDNEYLENFFGNNINITAIVGENGSGKSSIISYIMQILYKLKERNQKNYIFVYSKNSENYYQSNIEKLNTKIIRSEEDIKKDSYSILFDFSLGDGDIYNQKKDNYKKDYAIEPSRNYYTGSMGGISKIENQSYNANMYANAIYFYKYINKKVINDLKLPNFYKLAYKTKTKINKEEETLKNINTIKETTLTFEQLKNQIEQISFESFFEKTYSDIQDEILILFKLSFTNDENLEFASLSKGQQQIISYLGILTKLKKRFETKKYLNIFFDEVESTLHPNWQKNFINILIQFIQKSNFFEDYIKINLIFATHSPFILSDIPNENVIFLDKFDEKETKKKYLKLDIKDLENGNCINVSKDIELKTFGTNIHTLLSDGFFMSDGLMGEFAKSKITEIKDFYNKNKDLKNEDSNFKSKKDEFKKNKKYFENIQKIIGEPFLQTIIKNYLDELEILFNGKKEFLDKEIKRLEELRNELK